MPSRSTGGDKPRPYEDIMTGKWMGCAVSLYPWALLVNPLTFMYERCNDNTR